MRFITPDGEVFEGDTFTQIVEAMAAEKFDEPNSLSSYRHATANRVSMMHSVVIRADSDEAFVSDLCTAGLLQVDG